MISITRHTRNGWRTYLYENETMLQVGRPHQKRHANLDEIREPNKVFQLDENGKRKKKQAWREKKGKGGSKASLKKKKGERASSEFHARGKKTYGNGNGNGNGNGDESENMKGDMLDEAIKKKIVDELFNMCDAGKLSSDEEIMAMLRDSYKVKSDKDQRGYIKALHKIGAKFATVTEGKKEKMSCPDCGYKVSVKDKKCPDCGFNLKKLGSSVHEQEKAVKTSENEGGAKDKWTVADFKDQVEEWKKAGMDDESKLQGMVDKATEIAKKSTESAPGKATRAEVLGIMQGFMKKKG